MKRITIFAGILVLLLAISYTHAAASNVTFDTFSLATARAGHDRDYDRHLAEAADGPWMALARAGDLSLGGLSSFSLNSTAGLESGRASSFSMLILPLRVDKAGSQSITFGYDGMLAISSSGSLPYAYVGYSLAAFDNQHNKFREGEFLREIGDEDVDETFTFDYELDAGDEVQLLFLLRTFAKVKLKCYNSKGSDIADLNLLADFNNSFDIVDLDGLVVVPIPGAILLMGPALLGLAVLRKRRR